MKKIYGLLVFIILCSCAGGKYNYLFDTGKELDFSEGKWILNKTKSNSKVFDNELYEVSLKKFSEILGDSLIEMNTLRIKKPISPNINFELDTKELEEIRQVSGCDFLINLKGNIVSNGAGTLSYDNGDGYYSASNQSSVFVIIYDLNAASVISSSQVTAKATNENSHFDKTNGLSGINPSAETMMVNAAKKLIKRYDKNRLD